MKSLCMTKNIKIGNVKFVYKREIDTVAERSFGFVSDGSLSYYLSLTPFRSILDGCPVMKLTWQSDVCEIS